MITRKTIDYKGKVLQNDKFQNILGRLKHDPTLPEAERLSFIDCDLRDQEAEQLAETIIQNPTKLKNLKVLDLSSNHITGKGASKLKEAFDAHPSLEWMQLRGNEPYLKDIPKASRCKATLFNKEEKSKQGTFNKDINISTELRVSRV